MTAPSGASHLHTPESDASGCPAGFAAARAVADAVLYEGYLLYPYRRSSGKNRVRWQFGVLAPRSWIEAGGPAAPTVAGAADAWQQRTECLLEAAPDARVFVRLRFLQLQHRSVQDETDREVDAVEAGGVRHLTFDEAVPREVDIAVDLAALHGDPHVTLVEFPGGEEAEALPDGTGRVVRTRAPVSALVRASRADAPAPFLLHVLRVEVENTVADLLPTRPGPTPCAAPSSPRTRCWACAAERSCRCSTRPPGPPTPPAPASTCTRSRCSPASVTPRPAWSSPRRSSSTTTRGWRRRARATCSTPARSTRS